MSEADLQQLQLEAIEASPTFHSAIEMNTKAVADSRTPASTPFGGNHWSVLEEEEHESFDMLTFVKNFLFHMLLPLSLPFAILIDGPSAARNKRFLPLEGWKGTDSLFFTQNLFGSMIFIIVIFFILLGKDANVHTAELVVALSLFSAHKLMVASKWAVFSPSFRELCETTVISNEMQRRVELSSWRAPTDIIIQSELQNSCRRLGIDLDQFTIAVSQRCALKKQHSSSSSSSVTASVSADMIDPLVDDENEQILACHIGEGLCSRSQLRRVKAREFLTQLITAVYQRTESHFLLNALTGFIQACLPIIMRLAHGANGFGIDPSDSTTTRGLHIVIVIFSFLISFFFGFVLFNFAMIAMHDVKRRYRLLRACGALIDPSPPPSTVAPMPPAVNAERGTCKERFDAESFPFIDLAIASNVSAWLAIRQLAVHHGHLYRPRLTMYTSYILLVSLALLSLLLYQLISGDQAFAPTSSEESVQRSGGAKSFNDAFVLVIGFMVVVIFSLLGSQIAFGHLFVELWWWGFSLPGTHSQSQCK